MLQQIKLNWFWRGLNRILHIYYILNALVHFYNSLKCILLFYFQHLVTLLYKNGESFYVYPFCTTLFPFIINPIQLNKNPTEMQVFQIPVR
jgi:hypothetical protein